MERRKGLELEEQLQLAREDFEQFKRKPQPAGTAVTVNCGFSGPGSVSWVLREKHIAQPEAAIKERDNKAMKETPTVRLL
jgi:hypothetical protein